MKLSEKILYYRKKAGLSQEELAGRVGVSRQAVSKWELGDAAPEVDKLRALAREFGVTVDELLSEEVPREPEQAPPPQHSPTAGWLGRMVGRWGWLAGVYIALSGLGWPWWAAWPGSPSPGCSGWCPPGGAPWIPSAPAGGSSSSPTARSHPAVCPASPPWGRSLSPSPPSSWRWGWPSPWPGRCWRWCSTGRAAKTADRPLSPRQKSRRSEKFRLAAFCRLYYNRPSHVSRHL